MIIADLEQYVKYSAEYPYRLQLTSSLDETKAIEFSEQQFGFSRIAKNPATSQTTLFFENEEQMTMAKLMLSGTCKHTVF